MCFLLDPKAAAFLYSTVYVNPDEKVQAGPYSFLCRLDMQPFLDVVGVKMKAFRFMNLKVDSPMEHAASQCWNYNVDLQPHAQGKRFYPS